MTCLSVSLQAGVGSGPAEQLWKDREKGPWVTCGLLLVPPPPLARHVPRPAGGPHIPAVIGHLPAVAQAGGIWLQHPFWVQEVICCHPVVVPTHATNLLPKGAWKRHLHPMAPIKLHSQAKVCRDHSVEPAGRDLHAHGWGAGQDLCHSVDLEGQKPRQGWSNPFGTALSSCTAPPPLPLLLTVTLPPFPSLIRWPATSTSTYWT